MRLAARSLFAFIALLISAGAHAATCQQSVVSSGSLFSGHVFSAQVHAQGLSVDGAFKALRKQFDAAGLRILEEDIARGHIVAAAGAKMLEPARRVTFHYRQTREMATIDMEQSYPPGVFMSAAVAGEKLCASLAQLFRDTRPQPATLGGHAARAIVLDATALALQVKQARDNPARLNTQFIGQTYVVGGTVRRITETRTGYAVAFEVEPPIADHEIRKVWVGIDVMCQMERSRAHDVAALSVNGPARLVGRFAKFDDYRATPTIILEGCHGP